MIRGIFWVLTRVGGKGSGHEVARLCHNSTWGHSLTPGLPSCTRSQLQDIKFTCKRWGDLNVPMVEPPSSRLPCVPHPYPNMYPWKRLSIYCLQSMWVPPCIEIGVIHLLKATLDPWAGISVMVRHGWNNKAGLRGQWI